MPIMRRYKDLVAESSAGFNLGLPVEALRDMVAAGNLEQATGIETKLVTSDVFYSAAQLDDYFGFYIEHAGILPREEGFITFSDAMLMFPAGRRPWFALWEQILWGRIDSCMHREKTKALTDIVCVRAAEIDREALVARMAELPSRCWTMSPSAMPGSPWASRAIPCSLLASVPKSSSSMPTRPSRMARCRTSPHNSF
ncbi:hypothetical protein [Devosia sp.]|uniref:hypothetical protein n=1 Tax=Devosia sp. TaxID=1871048 RepID=UPI002930D0E3|nr:hypothetical protein [Devosia sp.]